MSRTVVDGNNDDGGVDGQIQDFGFHELHEAWVIWIQDGGHLSIPFRPPHLQEAGQITKEGPRVTVCVENPDGCEQDHEDGHCQD